MEKEYVSSEARPCLLSSLKSLLSDAMLSQEELGSLLKEADMNRKRKEILEHYKGQYETPTNAKDFRHRYFIRLDV